MIIYKNIILCFYIVIFIVYLAQRPSRLHLNTLKYPSPPAMQNLSKKYQIINEN